MQGETLKLEDFEFHISCS